MINSEVNTQPKILSVGIIGCGWLGKALAASLLEQGVSVLPGIGFGDCTEHYVRVSLAQPINILRPAFDRIAAYCEGQA